MLDALNLLILSYVAIVGLCLGSFYNVVILRSLSGESLVFPPSKCPKCGGRLKFWHNIPVLSYIFLGGKCAFCHEKISIQYPLVELLTMVLFTASFLKYGLSKEFIFAVIVLSGLLIMSGTDLKEKLVDCNIAIIIASAGLIYNFFSGNIILSVIGLAGGFLLVELFSRTGYLVAKTRAMGEADSYVAGALGACFGFYDLLYILFYSILAAMIFILPVFLYKQLKKKNWAMSLSFILFLVSALIYKFFLANYFIFSAMIIFGLISVVMILKNIRENGGELSYLPFVPALALGTLYFIFLS